MKHVRKGVSQEHCGWPVFYSAAINGSIANNAVMFLVGSANGQNRLGRSAEGTSPPIPSHFVRPLVPAFLVKLLQSGITYGCAEFDGRSHDRFVLGAALCARIKQPGAARTPNSRAVLGVWIKPTCA
jgi:hypothetical protein